MRDYYQILGVPTNATPAQIKAAYKKLALLYHPDRNPHDRDAEEKFKLINEAHQTLGDPEKKSRYDQRINYSYSVPKPPPVYNNPYRQRQTYTGSRYSRGRQYGTYRPKPPSLAPDLVRRIHVLALLGFMAIAVLALCFYNLMNHYASRTNYEEAMAAYAEKNYSHAFEKVHEATWQDDENGEAFYLKGRLLLDERHEPKAAIFCFSRAIEHADESLDRYSIEVIQQTKANYYFYRAKSYYEMGDFTPAFRDLEKVVQLAPENDEAYLLMGKIKLYKHSEYPRSLQYFAKSASYEARVGEAVAHFWLRDYPVSMDALQKVLDERPDGIAYYYMGYNYLLHLKDTANACIGWENARVLGVDEANIMLRRYCR